MGRKLVPSPEGLFDREAFEIFDDFSYYVKSDQWIDIQTDATSTVGIVDTTHSVIKMLASADNDTATLATTTEQLKFIASTPLYVESKFLFSDSTDQEAAIFFGTMDAIQLDRIADGGQAIVINDTGVVLWKKSSAGGGAGDGVNWIFESNVAGGTQVQNISTAVPQSASYQTVKIDCVPRSSTVFECRPIVNGEHLVDSTSGEPIMHTITLGTATDMDLGFELKGGHADDTSVLIDYIYASQGRA